MQKRKQQRSSTPVPVGKLAQSASRNVSFQVFVREYLNGEVAAGRTINYATALAEASKMWVSAQHVKRTM